MNDTLKTARIAERVAADALLFPGQGDGNDDEDKTHHWKLGGDMSEVKTFGQIRDEGGPEHTHHWRLTCVKCGGQETCKCSEPKVNASGICYYCCEKEGIDFLTGEKIMTAAEKEQSKCVVILPPKEFDVTGKASVFLAGAIDMGAADDWQKEIGESLKDVDCTVLNPRRKDWDKTWKQEIENPKFREQVEWELRGLEQCSFIALCLTKDSKAPISLLELGLHVSEGKMIVCCPDGFYRKGNVDIVCAKYNVPVFNNFDEFKGAVHLRMIELGGMGIRKIAASDRMAWRIMAREFVMRMHTEKTAAENGRPRQALSVDFNEMMRKRYAPHVPSFKAGETADPMAKEKLSSLFQALYSWATRKATSLPPGAPIATQILDGLNAVEVALRGKMGLRGREAVVELMKATNGYFDLLAPPFPSLIRKYGVDAIREAAGRFFATTQAGMGDTHPFGSPLRRRRDYGSDGESEGRKLPSEDICTGSENNLRVRVIADRIASKAKEFLGE